MFIYEKYSMCAQCNDLFDHYEFISLLLSNFFFSIMHTACVPFPAFVYIMPSLRHQLSFYLWVNTEPMDFFTYPVTQKVYDSLTANGQNIRSHLLAAFKEKVKIK